MDANKRAAGFLIFLFGIAIMGFCFVTSRQSASVSCVIGFLFFLGGLFIWDPARNKGEKP